MAGASAEYMREYRRRIGATKTVRVPVDVVRKAIAECSPETAAELLTALKGTGPRDRRS